ncbi:MAG: haloacid dehalogenase [Meiothermus sp.]
MLEFIAFDADDTLWHNETYFCEAQERFKRLMHRYLDDSYDGNHLYETEIRNLGHYGYGVKSFGLSMVETAIELTHGRISARDIHALIQLTKEMLCAPVEVLPEVEAVLDELSGDYPLLLITKGDLLDQESKILRSGLAEYFRHIEVVSEKDAATYSRILRRHRIRSEEFLMVGNSLRSDVLPVLELGGHAVHIPYPHTWAHEHVQLDNSRPKPYTQLGSIGELPEWLEAQLISPGEVQDERRSA